MSQPAVRPVANPAPGPSASATGDIITDFFSLTQDEWSPEIFRKWAGIALVAGALERRVWVVTGNFITYPNLYTLLVGAPGTGKGIIKIVRDLWTSAVEPGTRSPAFHVAPDSMTKASLIDSLADAKRQRHMASGKPYVYHSLLISAEEFSVLLPAYDMEYVGALNGIWNNNELHEERRRYGKSTEIKITYPQLNILGGVQPTFLASVFPEDMWTSGLGRRVVMIYSSEQRIRDPFAITVKKEELRASIIASLGRLSQKFGPITWTPEAMEFFREWCLGGCEPIPTHSKLSGYNQNRIMNAIKFSAISVASRGKSNLIELIDINRAKNWMLEAERVMPDIFRAMIGKSDWQVIEELYEFVVSMYTKAKNTPVGENSLYRFLLERVPDIKAKSLLEMCEKSHIIIRNAGTDRYVPGVKAMRRPE